MATGAGSTWRILIRHFWGRFFDTESLSPQGEPGAYVTQSLGILAVPSAFFVIICQPLDLLGWDQVAVRYWFLSFCMVTMALIMVLEWDALFPDQRDYVILMSLPLRLSMLFLAKALALGMFLGIYLIDINFFGAIFWPGIDGGKNVLAIMAVHITVMVSAGLFTALATASLQGILINILSATAFRRISVALQMFLITLLAMIFFLTPFFAGMVHKLVPRGDLFVYWFPPYWFLGLYEQLRPTIGDSVLLRLGHMAEAALAISALVFLVTYIPGYRRHARKVLETPTASATQVRARISGFIDRLVLRKPIERGIFHFIGKTITRSPKHRIFLATYGGLGLALVVANLGSGADGLLRMPLTLSFVLISGLRAAFNFPSEVRANWAFKVCDSAAVSHAMSATRKWIALCAVTPLFATMSVMELACFPWVSALFHLAYGVTLTLVLTEILFFGFEKVPFGCSYLAGQTNIIGLGLIYILGLTLYSRVMSSAEKVLTTSPIAAIAFLVIVNGARLVFLRWRARNLRESSRVAYEDEGDPTVRTLDITLGIQEEAI
jgi:hypothetical protein